MSDDNWYHSFAPCFYVGRVQLDQFLDKHRVEKDCIKARISPCVLCRSMIPPGLLLNNGAYLCSVCFEDLARVSFPEKYERLRRDYITAHEAWRLARTAYANAANERTDRLKGVVLRRDGSRGQVTGCPSRVAIHVHHMLPTSQGGEHKPDVVPCYRPNIIDIEEALAEHSDS